ncbi:F-box/kelch-repeat protein At3g23880-like [Cynara cardunculus var. scolymus]|uniref:F-box/kelch-repeat protein At3g23880-like n=1 Tax=Cynara cardunculus var. scolymus TaxID=59895 RepID=UPI000D624533|nr:F-box/kelch-repeat protein At3g23880-like [Cynara cardunculus var. scolymus]
MSDYDLIVEIFERLPPKSLLRFTSLSKSWFSHIVCPNFISNHALRAAKNPQKLLIRHLTYFNKHVQNFYTLHSEDRLPLTSRDGYIGITPLDFPGYNFHIVGSCNGIICLYDHEIHKITLWNPSIRRKLTLPHHHSLRDFSSNGPQVAIGFAFDLATFDYKIVKISYTTYGRDAPESSIYTINTGVWRVIAFPTTPLNNVSLACFVNGALYWLVAEPGSIMSFDLSTEVFGTIPLPEPSWEVTQLTIIKGYLAVVTNEGSDSWIWLRREYNNVASWSRDLKLNTGPYEGRISRVLQPTTDGDLVLTTQSEGYIVYDPVKGVRSRLASVKGLSIIVDIVKYKENLVLLNRGTGCNGDQPCRNQS